MPGSFPEEPGVHPEWGSKRLRRLTREKSFAWERWQVFHYRQLAVVQLHMQRALDCLEGPQGEDYRSVCKDACPVGAGAERDLPAGSVNQIRTYKPIRLGSVGVTFHDFKPAHFTAGRPGCA